MNALKNNFISSPKIESLFILAPPFLSVLLALLLKNTFDYSELTPVLWLIIVVGMDVSHVWTTLFRTYFNKSYFKDKSDLFFYTPLICFIVSVVFYSFGKLVFWKFLAYFAVFHFVRQQYGIFLLYSRKSNLSTFQERLGKTCIYLSTLTPMIHWHLNLPRNFQWFMEGDFFILGHFPLLINLLWGVTLAVFLIYLFNEFKLSKRDGINWQKNLILFGTLLSWSFGIVIYNDDLSFTITNVMTHGIPYFALIWLSSCSGYEGDEKKSFKLMTIFNNRNLFLKALVFIGVVFSLGYLEELFWDTFVWHEHSEIFSWLYDGIVNSDNSMLNLLVPLLSLPQLTHYVLDGFIWKGNIKYPGLKF
ncbi:MAG: hypothetical protein KC493_14550 [Bacteriovoracaceae bacterium]|nr:hypothetical protein [Bacteriovoracaceae bacterium]